MKKKLTIPKSRIRIADSNGEHISKPTICLRDDKYWMEWMIKNNEIAQLIEEKFSNTDKKTAADELTTIIHFFIDSQYKSRRPFKNEIGQTFGLYKIYEYKEVFYSFERELDTDTAVRVTFKQGDFGLTPHPFMFVLINFKALAITNKLGPVIQGQPLGSGAIADFKFSPELLNAAIMILGTASTAHRDDLIKLLGY